MRAKLGQIGKGCLEGLCARTEPAGNRIKIGSGHLGIERLEAHLIGQAFSPHRHDTYAIGITLSGVQIFSYRGERRLCLPGQYHVLHPDELHDGAAGTAGGFSYRIAYIDPALVQRALGGRPLPFVSNPVVERRALDAALPQALWRLEESLDDLAWVEIMAAVADMLENAAHAGIRSRPSLRLASLLRVRDLIVSDPACRLSMAMLEGLSGLDRWTLARQFRAAFGTSPSRFRTMRQLDRARWAMRDGLALAEAALAAGFADQSHMSRLFKRAYGLTPAKWAAVLA